MSEISEIFALRGGPEGIYGVRHILAQCARMLVLRHILAQCARMLVLRHILAAVDPLYYILAYQCLPARRPSHGSAGGAIRWCSAQSGGVRPGPGLAPPDDLGRKHPP